MTPLLLILTTLIVPNWAQKIPGMDNCKFSESIYEDGRKWNYQDFGSWDYGCRNGKLQSPIDLPRARVIGRDMGNLTFRYYASSPMLQRIVNTGHSIMMDVCDIGDRQPKISGSGLNGTYVFYQMHFHWAESNERGSEHSKSHTHFPLELQLIHYQESWGSYDKAKNQPEGLAILAVLFQLHVERNPKLERFFPLLQNVIEPYKESILDAPIPLLNLLPSNTLRFYRYHGSLTAPPCTENVVWTVFQNPIPILLKQMNNFRAILGPPDENDRLRISRPLGHNVRPLMKTNNRTIYSNLTPEDTASSGGELVRQSFFCVMTTLLLLGQ